MVINWEPPKTYFQDSKEGYRVSKQLNGGKPDYTAWTPLPREIIKNCKTADEAKAECELHAMEKL